LFTQTRRHGLSGRIFPRDGADGQTAEAHDGGEGEKGRVDDRVQRGNRRDGNVGRVRKISNDRSHHDDRIQKVVFFLSVPYFCIKKDK